jgi:hypothetical protein
MYSPGFFRLILTIKVSKMTMCVCVCVCSRTDCLVSHPKSDVQRSLLYRASLLFGRNQQAPLFQHARMLVAGEQISPLQAAQPRVVGINRRLVDFYSVHLIVRANGQWQVRDDNRLWRASHWIV